MKNKPRTVMVEQPIALHGATWEDCVLEFLESCEQYCGAGMSIGDLRQMLTNKGFSPIWGHMLRVELVGFLKNTEEG